MKPKLSPTSPKANADKADQLTEIYSGSAKTIERPLARRSSGLLGAVVLAIIFGFLSGIVGQLLFFTYGSSLPLFDRLSIFSSSTSPFFISSRTNTSASIIAENYKKTLLQIKPTVVQIFKQKAGTNDITAVYTEVDSLHSGFIVTNDGYIIVPTASIAEVKNLVVRLGDNSLKTVSAITNDAASGMSFLKIDAQDLSTAPFATSNSITVADDIVLIQRSSTGADVLVGNNSIASMDYYPLKESNLLTRSSDQYGNSLLLENAVSPVFDGAVAFTADGEALGLVALQDNASVIILFDRLTTILDQAFSGKEIARPQLGINFIDLASSLNIPNSLSQGFKRGILIYSTDEAKQPSINLRSPVQKAGLQHGDVITLFNGEQLNDSVHFENLLLSHKIGDTITLTYMRKGIEQESKVTLEALP